MALRLCFVLIILCALMGTSYQQMKKLRKRLGYVESVVGGINMQVGRTQADITDLQEAIELLQNESGDCSSCDKDQSPIDTTAIIELEAKLTQQEVEMSTIYKAVKDETLYAMKRGNQIGDMKLELNNSLTEMKRSLKEMGYYLTEMNNSVTEEIEQINNQQTDMYHTITVINYSISDEITQMNGSHAKEIQLVKSELVHTERENNKLTVELRKVKSHLRNTRRNIKKLRVDNNKVKSDLSETKRNNDQLSVELDKVKYDMADTVQSNNKLTRELREVKSDMNQVNLEFQKVQADLVKMINKQTKLDLVEENKDEILILKQILMEMQQKKTECCTATTTPTPQTTTEPTTTTTVTTTPQTTTTTEPPTTTMTTTPQTTTTTEPPTTTVPEVLSTCPDGWETVQHTCYLYVKRPQVKWDTANSRCTDQGGILAEPDTREKLQFLDQIIGSRAPWLGATDRQAEGTWVWTSSGRPVNSSLWYPAQPDSYWGDEDCMFMYDGGVCDGGCTGSWSYICERSPSSG